jgi:hypothetical protein
MRFWKHLPLIIYLVPVVLIFSISLIIAGIVNYETLGLLIIFGAIILILFIGLMLIDKRILSKVIISEKGISWIWLNKKIIYFNWDEISDIKITPYSRTSCYLTFVIGEQQINIDLTKKMYNTIMDVCPIPNIKMLINNIEKFKCFHRKDYK